MKSIKLWCILALILILLPAANGFSCTIVMAAKNDMVLVGNNEDYNNPYPKVTFVPATADRFGYICFGYEEGSLEGGMNDQGLFIDGNALNTPTAWHADPAKPNFKLFGVHILQTCATIADVRTFFENSNTPVLKWSRVAFADRSGASMVVEYADGKVRFVTETTWYQISTNFLRTDYPGIEVPCNRFRVARQMLDPASELNVPLIRSVMDATHQEGNRGGTVYSNIYDLKAGIIYVYLWHNFKEEVILNLDDELKKSARTVKLSALFPKKSSPATKTVSPTDGK